MQLPATAGKVLFEDEALVDLRDIEKPPTRRAVVMRVDGVAQLEHQQPLDSLVNAVVVRLGDAHAPVVTDLNQVLVLDRISQSVVQRR